jgi:hypothetical protein
MPVAISDVEPIIKRFYKRNRMRVIGKPRSPLFMNIMKNTEARGQYRAALQFGQGGGRSADFPTAQANTTSTSKTAFVINGDDLSDDYAVAQVSNKTLLHQEKASAVAEVLITESNAKIRKLIRSTQIGLYSSDGSRLMGTVESESGTSLVLTERYMVRRFEPGDQIVAADGAGATTAALRDSGDFVTVVSVDPSTRTIVGDSDWATTISGLVTGDHVFHRGDAANGGAVRGIFGLPAWAPSAAPGATLFFGVNRTLNTERLGGLRYDGSGDGSIREALIAGAHEAFDATQGEASISECYLGVSEFKRLAIELDDARERAEKGRDAEFGYSFIRFHAGPYEVKCMADPENVTGRAFLVDPDTLELASLRDIPHPATFDGSNWLRMNAQAAIEMRWEAFSQMMCDAPGFNMNVGLPAA